VRLEAERKAAEDHAREEAFRRQLQEELVRAEAEEAERRRATEALERERLDRLAELARLEEEATRRQIADERARLAAIDEVKQRRDEELLAAQARSRELRDLLEGPEPLGPAAAEVMNRPLPPPKPLPPIPPPEVRPTPVAATEPAPTKPGTRHWIASSPAHVVGAACLIAATAVAIGALFINGEYLGHPLHWGASSDLNAVVLTLSLLAPLFARSVGDAAAITTGVTVGYLAHQGLTDVSWFWGVDGGPAWPGYRTALVVVGLLLLAARVMFRRRGERDADPLRSTAGTLVAQIVLAILILVTVVTYLDRWHTYYTALYSDSLDSDIWAEPDAQFPRLAFLFLLPSLLLLVWATRRTHAAAVTLIAMASVASIAYVTDAFDMTGASTGSLARGEFTFAAAAAAGIVFAAVHNLVWSKTRA
jgi:hypothetical protein